MRIFTTIFIIILFFGCNSSYHNSKDESLTIDDDMFLLEEIAFRELTSEINNESSDCPKTNPCPDIPLEKKQKLEEIAIDAVRKEQKTLSFIEQEHYNRKGNIFKFEATCLNQNYFKNSKIFKVFFNTGPGSWRSFNVAIVASEHTHVFKSYEDVNKFSAVILEENIVLKTKDIKRYIESLLFLVGVDLNIKIVESIDDLTNAGSFSKDNLERVRSDIKPINIEIEKDLFRITYFVFEHHWKDSTRYKLKKCLIIVDKNGKIINFNIDKIGLFQG